MLRAWYKHLSLRTKATGISLAITMLALGVVVVIGIAQIRRQGDDEQHRLADAITLDVTRASELPLAVRDTKELSRVTNSFLRDGTVLFVAVYDRGPIPLATAVRDPAAWQAYLRGENDTQNFIVGQCQVTNVEAGDEFLAAPGVDALEPGAAEIKTSVRRGGGGAARAGQTLGRVAVGISTTSTLLAQRRQSRLTIAVAGIAGTLGALALFLTLGQWLRRLQRLTAASQAISRGELDVPIADSHDDEIGRLAQSFDSMRLAIRQRGRQLHEFNQTLQEQVHQRTGELEGALATAEQASNAKSLFLANMSHELRTPLNGVIGMVDLLLAAHPNPQQRRYCDVAKGSARQLLELINDILDFSKIEAGKLELDASDFDLHETIAAAAQMLGQKAEAKKLELACKISADLPQTVCGDPVRLGQVIANLLSNAIKFTEKGEVIVHAAVEKQTETHVFVRFTVRDTGMGIPPERLDRLFKSFSQVDASTTRRFGGTGLGLAISQRLVEMMGGRIGVESRVGHGSAFWFIVRLEKRAQVPAPPAASAADIRGMRVLAVDDNATNREILATQLASWSLRVDVAADAQQASDLLAAAAGASDPYRLAILDMQMPKTDGLQLAWEIRSNPALRGLILISLSSIGDQISTEQKRQLGLAACLSKPVQASHLYDAIVYSVATAADDLPCPTATAAPTVVVAAAPATTGFPAAAAPLAGMRVLLAEDNEVNRFVASEILTQAGADCSIAVDGREALDAAMSREFDVILMDCQMPVMDGFEATRQIRATEAAAGKGEHRPIVALTANAIKGDHEICVAAGMDDYLTKPIDSQALVRTLRALIPNARRTAPPQNTAPAAPQAPPPQPTAAAAPPSPVDLQTLQKRCMGNPKLAAMSLQRFDVMVVREIQALAQAVQNGDAPAAAATAHKIKGAAANVSAENVRQIAAELENLAKTDALAQSQACLDQLHSNVQEFRDYLATALAQLAPVQKSA